MDILQSGIYPYTREIYFSSVIEEIPSSYLSYFSHIFVLNHIKNILIGYSEHFYEKDGVGVACICHDTYAASLLLDIFPNIDIDEILAIISRVRWLDYNNLTLKDIQYYISYFEGIK